MRFTLYCKGSENDSTFPGSLWAMKEHFGDPLPYLAGVYISPRNRELFALVLSDITTIIITIDSYDISHDSRSITIMIFNFSLQQ